MFKIFEAFWSVGTLVETHVFVAGWIKFEVTNITFITPTVVIDNKGQLGKPLHLTKEGMTNYCFVHAALVYFLPKELNDFESYLHDHKLKRKENQNH